jgi:hypothetical protein
VKVFVFVKTLKIKCEKNQTITKNEKKNKKKKKMKTYERRSARVAGTN